MKYNLNNILFAVLLIPMLLIAKLHFVQSAVIENYSSIWILSSLMFFLSYFVIKKIEVNVNHLIIFFLMSIIVQISFLNYEPIGSDDIYRYMWDGKVQDYNINPYLYKPIDKVLEKLHSDILPTKMNFKEMKTIYFPLSQWLFYIGYKLSGENFWGYKFLIFISLIITTLLIYKLLIELNISIKNILLFVISPLIYFQFSIDGHLDAFGLPLLLASLLFYISNKKILSAIFLGLSFSIKPIAIILIPIFFLEEKLLKDKLKFVIISLLALAIQFLPYLNRSNPFEAFFIYTKNWMYNGFIFTSINNLLHNNQSSRLISWLVMIIFLIPVYFKKMHLIKKTYFSFFLMIIFSPVVHPWYISWLLILIPFTNYLSGVYLVSFVSLTSITIVIYKLTGIWKDFYLIQVIEFLPAIIFLFYEFVKEEGTIKLNYNSEKLTAP